MSAFSMDTDAIDRFDAAMFDFGVSSSTAYGIFRKIGKEMRLAHARQTVRWFLHGVPATPILFQIPSCKVRAGAHMRILR